MWARFGRFGRGLLARMSRCRPVEDLLREHHQMESTKQLARLLGWPDLLALGAGCIIGAGIFVLTGQVAKETAGPAISLSYLISGVACVFSGLCYTEFAARIPIAGSAYLYAYCAMGEFVGWIVGWSLILEYLFSLAAVARGCSAYLVQFFDGLGVVVPSWLYNIPFTCSTVEPQSFNCTIEAISNCTVPLYNCTSSFNSTTVVDAVCACNNNIDLTAFVFTLLIMAMAALGTNFSSKANMVMMVLTIAIILFVIIAGSTFVDPLNWTNFFPFGAQGVFSGAGVIFFAYVGFDTVSTFAEETRNPKRDLPIAIIGSILVSTTLYIAVSLVVTGMIPYYELSENAPLADAFAAYGLAWAQIIIAIGAFMALITSLLTTMMGLPRIFLAMARDGLLFPFFALVSPRFHTPFWGTMFTGIVAAFLALMLDLGTLADMVSIGTLLAFFIVCAGIIVLRLQTPKSPNTGTWLVIVYSLSCLPVLLCLRFEAHIAATITMLLLPIVAFIVMLRAPRTIPAGSAFLTPWVPLIPCLGIIFNLFLMINLGPDTWLRLFIWLVVGLIMYFAYGIRNSKMESYSPDESISLLKSDVTTDPSTVDASKPISTTTITYDATL